MMATTYRLRWLTREEFARGIELWHLSRTALANCPDRSSRTRRLGWAADQLAKERAGLHPTAAYKDLEGGGVGELYAPEILG